MLQLAEITTLAEGNFESVGFSAIHIGLNLHDRLIPLRINVRQQVSVLHVQRLLAPCVVLQRCAGVSIMSLHFVARSSGAGGLQFHVAGA